MATGMKCDNCGKGIMIGHRVSHAKNRTRRIFRPNLHWSRITIAGVTKKMKLCTKCLRQLKRQSSSIRQAQDKKVTEVSSIAPVATGLV